MAKFRKKPVVVEATRWFKNGDHPDDGVIDEPILRLAEGKVVRRYNDAKHGALTGGCHGEVCGATLRAHGVIETLEGVHLVCPGDWIITGVAGEYYPCKDPIFRATYEAVEP